MDTKLIYVLLWVCILSSCGTYRVADYIQDHTKHIAVSKNGSYITVFCFENPKDVRIPLINEYPILQRLTHTEITPDSTNFYRVVVFIPAGDSSWTEVHDLINDKSVAKAFTLLTKNIYVVFRPDYWRTGTQTDVRETAVHELMHHVSKEIYGDYDARHAYADLWTRGGLIDQILALYKNRYEQETE